MSLHSLMMHDTVSASEPRANHLVSRLTLLNEAQGTFTLVWVIFAGRSPCDGSSGSATSAFADHDNALSADRKHRCEPRQSNETQPRRSQSPRRTVIRMKGSQSPHRCRSQRRTTRTLEPVRVGITIVTFPSTSGRHTQQVVIARSDYYGTCPARIR